MFPEFVQAEADYRIRRLRREAEEYRLARVARTRGSRNKLPGGCTHVPS
jgi:hypothetical protein